MFARRLVILCFVLLGLVILSGNAKAIIPHPLAQSTIGQWLIARVPMIEDPGWWQRMFYGHDRNLNGQIDPEERGVLLIVWWWLFTTVINLGIGLLELLWAALPDDWQPVIPSIAYYVSVANHWLPLDIASQLYLLYLSTLGTILALRHLLKIIPGVG